MDIVKNTSKKPDRKKYWLLGLVGLIVVLVIVFTNRFQNVTYIANASSILINSVQRGDLQVTVDGYGKLTPSNIAVIGAASDGLVREVKVRAGDVVQVGDVLLAMENYQLVQEQQELKLEVTALSADHSVNRINRESELLDLTTEVANAEIDYQDVKLTLDAQEELFSAGKPIVSRIEYERTILTAQKYHQRWKMHQDRVRKYQEVMEAADNAENARLEQAIGNLGRINTKVNNLSIKASVSGIAQEMSFSPGQQIRQGDVVTRIARPDDLVAEIRIQELQVKNIELGMPAIINTRNSQIKGQVSRIDPAVIDGTVLVELEILDRLPREARPDLNVDAVIEVAHVTDTMYIRRPVFAEPFSSGPLYVLNEKGDIANRRVVHFGQASSSLIEIIEGLVVGDRVITSDPTDWLNHEKILVR